MKQAISGCSRRRSARLALLAFGAAAPAVSAQVPASWTSPLNGNWVDAGNWSTAPVYPNNTASTTFHARLSATGLAHTVSLADDVAVSYLGVNSPDATLAHDAGALTIGTFAVGDDAGGGRYHLAGGTLNVADQTWIGGGSPFSNAGTLGGTGAFHQTGGYVNASTATVVGYGGGTASLVIEGSQARYVVPTVTNWPVPDGLNPHGIGVRGGHGIAAFRNAASVTLGRIDVGAATGTGTVTIDSGAHVAAGAMLIGHSQSWFSGGFTHGYGTVTLSGSDARLTINSGSINVGTHTGQGSGRLIVSDGTLTVLPQFPIPGPQFGVLRSGRFDIDGGRFDCQRGLAINGGDLRVTGGISTTTHLSVANGGSMTVSGGSFSVGREMTIERSTYVQTGGNVGLGTVGLTVRNNSSSPVFASATFSGGSFDVDGDLSVTGWDGSSPASFTHAGGRLRAHDLRIQHGTFNIVPASGAVPRFTSIGPITGGIPGAYAGVDIADSAVIVDYTGPNQLAAIKQLIAGAFRNGAWDGPGIRSSVAAAASASFGVGYAEAANVLASFPATFHGQAVDDTTVLIAYARLGDANLDNAINLGDFNRLAINFGATDAVWSQGDFNYDRVVNLADFNLLAANFGLSASSLDGPTPQDWANLAAVVPEPAIAGLAPLTFLARRRRSRQCRRHPPSRAQFAGR